MKLRNWLKNLTLWIRKVLRVVFHPPLFLLVFFLYFILDYLLTVKYGEGWDEILHFNVYFEIFIVIYFIIGFCRLTIGLIRKWRLWKGLIFLALVIIILYFFHNWLEENFKWSFYIPAYVFILLVSFVFSLPVFLAIKLKQKFSGLRMPVLTAGFLILLVIPSGFIYLVYRLNKAEDRLTKIENKLGGAKKINCSEKDSIDRVRKSVVRVIGGESEGSGFAIQSGGVILTNFHVIEFEPSPKIILPDNTFETGEVIMADKNTDLAIISINRDLPSVSCGVLSELNPAEELLAVGFPLGGYLSGEATVYKGALSGRRRSKDVGVEYLQTDTTFTGGVSGGPMINICGEVVGINTAGLAGLGLAISSDSIKQKWMEMATSEDSLKDVQRITFDPDKSPLEAVTAFYNYLKIRKLGKAFELLSDNFKAGYSFSHWKKGYGSLLDTSVISIKDDEEKENRVKVKLSTKDLVNEEIVYKFFEGYWDIKDVKGKWLLWEANIKEIKEPDFLWFYDEG